MNGLQDRDETGIGGVVIKLLNAADNSELRTTTSAPDGSYLFMNVPAGRYILEYQANSSWYFSPNGLGSDRNIDSNPEPNSGRTGIITITETWPSMISTPDLFPRIYRTWSSTKPLKRTAIVFIPVMSSPLSSRFSIRDPGGSQCKSHGSTAGRRHLYLG